jgi:hypothetical protein
MRNTILSNILWPCALAFLLWCGVGISACSRPAQPTHNTHSNKSYLPAFLKGIELGQDQATVLKLRPNTYPVNSLMATTWQQYTEDLEAENMTAAYYNFEKTGDKRLVSLELLHKNAAAAATTFKNFGGTVSSENAQERKRTDTVPIAALHKGNRVTFSLLEKMQKNNPNNNE